MLDSTNRTFGTRLKKWTCFLFSSIGFFFSCITPSASGGQPAQIYYMRRKNIPIPVATLVLMIVTITYKAVLVLVGLSDYAVGTIVILQAVISISVDMLPLPGGMGISEKLFLTIFVPVFGAQLVLPGMILSRALSYYTELLLSALLTILAHFTLGRERKK